MVRRRSVLAGLAGLRLAAAAQAAPGLRVAVLDWGLAETCLALGCVPVGVPAPDWYDRYAVEPPMPPTVPDIGLLFTPNFEVLQELAPDAMVVPPALMLLRGYLERIAPLIVTTLYRPAPGAYGLAQAETRRLADRLGISAAAAALIADCDAALAAAHTRLAAYDGRPVLLLSVLDSRHVNVFGANSLYHDVLEWLGLRNAWTGAGGGEFVTVGVDRLASLTEARFVVIALGGGDRLAAMTDSPLWQALAPVQSGRVVALPSVLGSGGLPAARRLARLLADRLAVA